MTEKSNMAEFLVVILILSAILNFNDWQHFYTKTVVLGEQHIPNLQPKIIDFFAKNLTNLVFQPF
jgi:hypothetical protein